ncbi:hypothetical protein [Dyadobacter sp. 32]|uniref:hypothetical protein n=1 Tax=Dyadobacter sp. 32 TaxID=538966 RepID=UPI0011EE3500
MAKLTTTLFFACLLALTDAASQTPVTAYTTQPNASTPSDFTATGYIPINPTVYNTHITRDNRNFSSFFGTSYPSSAATTSIATGFVAGGKTFSRVSASPTTPFTKINIQRKDNPAYTGNRFSGFFEYSSVRTAGGTEQYNVRDNGDLDIFIKPAAIYTMEAALNNFSLSYGSDNIFSNYGTGNVGSQGTSLAESGNNIERVDLIYAPGMETSNAANLANMGVLVNERGGNDAFKVAAITGLDINGDVASLGSIVSVASNAWGTAAGPDISTVVFMGAEGSGNINPKELVGMSGNSAGPPATQKVAGIFFSLSDLGIGVNTPVYGLAIFPGDITTDFLSLNTTPTNTPDAGTGGLDLMSGSFFAIEQSILPVTLASFDGKLSEGKPLLTWITTSETNFDGFQVMRSDDAKKWETIEFVLTKQVSDKTKTYKYVDENAPSGINYYRLKLVDLDQSYAYSKIIQVSVKGENILFPNPVSSTLHVKASDNDLLLTNRVDIRTTNGWIAKSVNTTDKSIFRNGIPISDLPNGNYIVQMIQPGGSSKSYSIAIVR